MMRAVTTPSPQKSFQSRMEGGRERGRDGPNVDAAAGAPLDSLRYASPPSRDIDLSDSSPEPYMVSSKRPSTASVAASALSRSTLPRPTLSPAAAPSSVLDPSAHTHVEYKGLPTVDSDGFRRALAESTAPDDGATGDEKPMAVSELSAFAPEVGAPTLGQLHTHAWAWVRGRGCALTRVCVSHGCAVTCSTPFLRPGDVSVQCGPSLA